MTTTATSPNERTSSVTTYPHDTKVRIHCPQCGDPLDVGVSVAEMRRSDLRGGTLTVSFADSTTWHLCPRDWDSEPGYRSDSDEEATTP